MKLVVEPVERGTNVVNFAAAMIVLAMAQSRAAKIEAQHRKTKTVQRLHGMKDDLIVHGPAKQGMRMTDEGSVRGILGARIKQRLELPSGAIEHKRTNCAACRFGWFHPH